MEAPFPRLCRFSDLSPWIGSLSLASRIKRGDKAKYRWDSSKMVKKGLSKKTGRPTVSGAKPMTSSRHDVQPHGRIESHHNPRSLRTGTKQLRASQAYPYNFCRYVASMHADVVKESCSALYVYTYPHLYYMVSNRGWSSANDRGEAEGHAPEVEAVAERGHSVYA